MDLLGGLRWRYQAYLEPFLQLYGKPVSFLRRYWANASAIEAHRPLAYICADPANSGDYASFLGIRQLVGKPGVELFCAPLALKSTLKSLASLRRHGRRWGGVFIGGGGLFQECFDPFWEGVLELDLPLVVFGVGANQLDGFRRVTAAALLDQIVRRAVAVHVRDDFTYELLGHSHGCQISVGICPSVNYICKNAQKLTQRATHLLHVYHTADLRLAGVNLRQMREFLRSSAGRLGLIYDEIKHLGGLGKSLLTRYARAALVVSSRLHGCIFSYALGKPFLAIECDRKMSAFLESHAPGSACIPARLVPANLSMELLHQVIRQPPHMNRELKATQNKAAMERIVENLNY